MGFELRITLRVICVAHICARYYRENRRKFSFLFHCRKLHFLSVADLRKCDFRQAPRIFSVRIMAIVPGFAVKIKEQEKEGRRREEKN